MDSDDEVMIHQFMEEEAAANTDEDEYMAILTCLLQLLVAEDAGPILGGSYGWAKEIEF
jgi:hypothetical protein